MLLSDRRRHACSADQTRHATAPDHAATPTPTAAPHTLKSAKVEDEWIAATNFLAAKDFSYGRDWETYWSRVHPASDWLEGEGTIQERLLDRVHTAVLELVDSRLLDILPAGGAIASPPAEPDALS